jgi:hypothetical protein
MGKVTKGTIVGVDDKGDEENVGGVKKSNDGFMTEFVLCTFIMCFSNRSGCFFRGKWSRRMFEVKGYCANVNVNISKRRRDVKRV